MTQPQPSGIRPTRSNMEPDKTQEYLDGLKDVCDGIRLIIAGGYSQTDMINPEPMSAVMKRHTDHIRIMQGHMVGVDLTEFTDVAALGEAWNS